MISTGEGLQSVLDSIVQYTRKLTNSDACWLEFWPRDLPERMAITAAVNLSETEKNILAQSEENTLTEWVIENKLPVLIDNLNSDKRTLHLRLQRVSWKSLIAVPLIRENSVLGILYSAKKGVRVLNEKDLNTLTSFGVQANVALGNYTLTGQNLRTESDIEQKRWSKSEVNENLELALVLPQSDRPAPFVSKIDLGDEYICYMIAYAAEQGTATKGILKTLFSMESDVSKVYSKAVAIRTEMQSKSGFDLIHLNRNTWDFTVVTGYPFVMSHFDSHKGKILEYNANILQPDTPGQVGYYQFEKTGKAGDFFFSCPANIILKVDLNEVFKQASNQPATEGLAGKLLDEILLKIVNKVSTKNKNPDVTPGIFMLVKLVEKATAGS
jgi:hypothetical protein